MSLKRVSNSLALVPEPKRTKNEIAGYQNRDKALAESGIPRTSGLLAPIMLLEGHQGEIFSCEFHPQGDILVSTGFDRQIYLWTTYGECENMMAMSGHTGAVMEIHFSTDGTNLYTCSTDKTLAIWDITTGNRVRRLKGHTNFVNSVQGTRRGMQMLCSGSDDQTIKIWDARKRFAVNTLENPYQVTAVCFNDLGDQIISSGIDNDIKVLDMRKNEIIYTLRGHTDTVTGLSLSPNGSYLLSNSMDNTLRIWDVRPYAPEERCVKVFTGNQHNFEKNLLRCAWSPDGGKISAGSSDRYVYIWDTTSRRIMYKLPGHNGSVNDVHFHPKEPIILSGSSDKTLYLGEIDA